MVSTQLEALGYIYHYLKGGKNDVAKILEYQMYQSFMWAFRWSPEAYDDKSNWKDPSRSALMSLYSPEFATNGKIRIFLLTSGG